MKKKRQEAMNFLEHLEELRRRLIIIAIMIIVATIVCFTFANKILNILILPAEDLKLVFLSPPEAFMANIRLAFTIGILVTAPLTIHQIILFILPALRRSEKRLVFPLVVSMIFFFALGVCFAYYVVFPFIIRFFMGFATSELLPMFSVSNYIAFATSFLMGFGVVFQTPLVFWFLGRIGVVSPDFLSRNRKYAILVISIISAILTPPDVFSQLLMMGPLMILYEIGLFLVKISQRQRKKSEEKKEAISIEE